MQSLPVCAACDETWRGRVELNEVDAAAGRILVFARTGPRSSAQVKVLEIPIAATQHKDMIRTAAVRQNVLIHNHESKKMSRTYRMHKVDRGRSLLETRARIKHPEGRAGRHTQIILCRDNPLNNNPDQFSARAQPTLIEFDRADRIFE